MEYYIKEGNWKQIFGFLKSMKGIHSKNEEKLRMFVEAVGTWPKVAASGGFYLKYMAITEVYTGDLKSGVKRKFGKSCLNIHRSQIWKCT
ncbi:MAG: hypothetical protein PG980_000183 [Wolbachia endosymbiont of Ctenocephalides felis wCfeJ]|nr:MAG: hypothetical protein PG980_000183 [Wolbachia endosymbiont of Ctenocephalides felis wCfeJ]